MNLISNAILSTRRGVITVTVHEKKSGANGFAAVTVTDTGNGIESDRLPFIFDRYYSSAPGGSGTGLGLYITKQLVEAQGAEELRLDIEKPRLIVPEDNFFSSKR